MATDSTNLPQGEANVDASTDMAGSELDLAAVQLAQVEGAQSVDLPKGNQIVRIPVNPGDVIQLPTDSTDHVLAKIGPEGNLAFVIDGRTIILQGYVKANEQSPVKIVTTDGDTITPADVIASTDPNLDIITAAGPAAGAQGDTTPGSGIFVPFAAGPGLGLIDAEGVLGATALQYKLIDDEQKQFVEGEEGSPEFNITFDILGGIINEDDLPPDQIREQNPELSAAKFVLGGHHSGTNGEGNDPFDTQDREQGSQNTPPDDDGTQDTNVDDNGAGVDNDREPLQTVATINVSFPGGSGFLTLGNGLPNLGLPTDLKSEGELVTFVRVPGGGGVGDKIIGFVDGDGDPTTFNGLFDRLVVTVEADKDSSTGEFKVTFTLFDNLDNEAPDADKNGEPDLLGANEQIFDLPLQFTLTDVGGSHASGILPLGVEDDIPFFGKVVGCEADISIVCTDADIVHDETRAVDCDADDVNVNSFWVKCLGKELACSIIENGYELPSKCETEGTLKGAAKTQVHVSFGADGPAVFIEDGADPTARNSIFGELEDREQGDENGENEHPFELFMVKGGTPVDSKLNPVTEGDLTIDEQATNTTVYWDDANPELRVYIDQIDAHTIVGYVNAPDCEEGTDKVAVFTLYIDDNGCMSFYQYHQLNHDIDGKSHDAKDDSLFITDQEGNPLIYVRATDYDGDHAIQPVGLEIQDDGPRCCGIDWGNDCDSECGVGVIDEEALRHGIWGGPGDDKGGKHTDGKILVDFGVDKPGHMEIQELCVRDCTGKTVLKICIDENGCLNVVENCLKAIDERALAFEKCGPDDDGKVTWTAFIAGCPGEKVFSFTLDTSGACIGEFDFCLFKPLEHPLTSGPELLPALLEQNGGHEQTSYEDNFKFDFKVRSYDSDGDYADCNVKLSVDDDSPDACKVEISFCDEDNKLVHDETKGVQTGGDDWNDPDHSGQPEDDTWFVKDFGKFEKEEHCLDAIGYAKTVLKVDLSGGTNCPTAAFGADGPGSVSPVSIVTDCGKNFCGEKTNLHDTKTGCAIFLFTEVVCGESYVVGRVGGEEGPVSFALHVSDCGDLELAQYRAIQHPDGCDSDESLKLLDCEGNALIHLQVAVTDADGDTVYARQAVDGCHGNPSIVFQDDGPTFCGIDWGRCEYDSVRGVGVIDEEALRGGIPGGPGDDAGGKHADGKLNFKFGTDCEGGLEITELKVKDNSGKTVLEICAGPGGELFVKENCLQAIDNRDLCFEQCGPDAEGKVTWTAFVKDCPSEKVFTFTLDTQGACLGEFDFCLLKPLEHPDNNGNPYDNYQDDGKGSFEDNFKFDFTVRATDGDGDKVDANVCISVDDDSPDACKVDISLCDANNKLVHDETEGVQDGGKFIPGDGDKDPSYQDEDDVCEQPKDYEKFEDKLDLCAIGYAVTEIKVDLSGGNPYKPNAAFGADGPGSVDVALVANNGQPFCGEKTNLHDTKTGEAIFLYTVEECGESFVVGRICGEDGPIVFALHVSDCGDLELAQYRAIQHPDGCDPDESITLLDCNGKDGIINIKVTVTDADGDAVCVTKPLDGCHDNPSIVFQDDGPCVTKCPEGKVVLAMDETDTFSLKDYQQTDVADGPKDGPTPEGDLISTIVNLIGGIFPEAVPHVLSAAHDNVADLFKVDFGTDGGCEVCYDLTILCEGGKTNLRDTETGTCISLVDCGNGIVKGVDGEGHVVLAFYLNHETGEIYSAQFRAIDHGGEENPSAVDEVKFLGDHILGVTATAYDKDGDKDCKTVDIGCGISIEDDGPKADIDEKHNAKIVLDESNGTPNQYTDTNANDENDSADPTDIAYAKVAGNLLFSDNSDFGADGPGSKVFSLETSDGTDSGLVDAASDAAILLYKVDDNTVEGRVGGIAGAVAFRIDTDPTSGEVTISQFLAVEHNNAGDSSSTHDESGSSAEIMDPSKLFLKVTVTDGDYDIATDKIDLGKLVKFEDDGPIARNDTDTVTEGILQEASGNVITGVDGILGTDENGEDGVADDPGTDGLQSIAWQGAVSNEVEGKYGTLTVDANGNYRYDLNEADDDLKSLDTGESDYEVFTYTITDKDGDTDTATLKIKVIGENDTQKPNFEDENALVDEDGLPAGILNDPVAPTNDPAPGDDVGGHQEGGLPAVASEAIFRDSLNINWDLDVGTIAFSVTDADLATIHPLSGAVLTTANVSGNGTGNLEIWDGVPGASNLILDVKLIDNATSVYEVQLHQPIKHTDPNSEDNKSLPVKVTATNDGGVSEHTLTIGIDDDRPVANDDPVNTAPGVAGTADVLFIVDVSGSMDETVDGVPDFPDTRIGLARYSMFQLLTNHPEILNVQFVKFDDDVDSPTSLWMSRADALTYIQDASNFDGHGRTNYDLALGEAMDKYDINARPVAGADQTLVYFLSDGHPNDGDGINEEPIDNTDNPGVISRTEWEQFVTTNGISHVFAIGIGDGVDVDELEPVAYPNGDTNPADGQEDHVVVVPTSNLTALTQTLDDLLGTVVSPVSGNVLTNDDPGADGYGAPELVEVIYGATHYVFGAPDTEYDIDLGVGRGSLHIDQHGAYTYTPPSGDVVDGTPFSVQYVVRDGDGDNTTANINIDLNSRPLTDLNGVAGGDDVTVSFTEQTPVLIAPAATITDDGANLASMTVTLTNRPNGDGVESLSLIGAAATAASLAGLTVLYTAGTGVLSITGTASVAVYQSILQGIQYNNTSDAPNTADRAVDVVVNDGTSNSVVNISTITVSPVNDAPDAIAPAVYNATEQTNLNLHGAGLMSISDVDAGSGVMKATLSVGAGTLTVAAGNSGVDSITGSGTASVVITGTVTEINNLLGGVDTGGGSAGTIVFGPSGGNTPPASTLLTLKVEDNGNTGAGGNLSDTAVSTINIAAVNDAPNTSNTSASGAEDASKIAVNLSGTDPDGSVAQFKITSLPSDGKLYADLALTNEITLNETVTALANAAVVYFVPNLNFNGAASFQYASIDDLGLEDASPATASLTVTPVADATVANPDSIITAINNDNSFTVPHFALLANDSDPDGPLSINQITAFDGGNTFDNVSTAGGNVTVDTDNDFDPTDVGHFTYKATDGTSSATAIVTVTAVADANITGTDNGEIIIDSGSSHTINAGKGNDFVFANGGDDILNGGDGDDYLDGGADDDTYTGGKGNDTINVGSGNDTVNYTSTLDGTDVIDNFDANGSSHDTLNLDALFDSLLTADGLRAGRVQIVDNGSTVEINVNADGAGGTFELHVATLNTNDTVNLGTDVTVGTL